MYYFQYLLHLYIQYYFFQIWWIASDLLIMSFTSQGFLLTIDRMSSDNGLGFEELKNN